MTWKSYIRVGHILADGQAHMGRMGNNEQAHGTWYCKTKGRDNSIEFQIEKIHPAVSETCVLQAVSLTKSGEDFVPNSALTSAFPQT